MPVTGESNSGNYIALRGENCNLIKVKGVKVFEDENGVDLLKLIKKQGGANPADSATIAHLTARLDALEKAIQNIPAGPRGAKGERGEIGESGRDGLQGPRGKGLDKILDMTDVDADGLDDGDILVWSAAKKKWVVSHD